MKHVTLSAASALGSLLLLWSAFCLWFYLGDNATSVMRPVSISAEAWDFISGQGAVEEDALVLKRPGSRGHTVLHAPVLAPIRGSDVDRVVVFFREPVFFHRFAIGISDSPDEGVVRGNSANWNGHEMAVVDGDSIPDGDLHSISLAIQSALEGNVAIDSTLLHRRRPEFFELQFQLVRSLFDFSGWTQRSINSSENHHAPLRLHVVPVMALWILTAVALILGWQSWRARSDRLAPPRVLIVLGLLMCFILDFGWQLSMLDRHVDAVRTFGSASPDLRRLEGPDADSFRFVEEVKNRIDDPDARMVIFGNTEFAYLRARYYAVPNPVVGRLGAHTAWLSRMRPGDILLSIGRNPRLQRTAVTESSADSASLPSRGVPIAAGSGGKHGYAVSEWVSVDASAIAAFELVLAGRDGSGWARIMVERSDGEELVSRVRRDVYLSGEQRRRARVPFDADDAAEYRVRVHAEKGLEFDLLEARIGFIEYERGLERLWAGEDGPYVLARKMLSEAGNVAWEIQ